MARCIAETGGRYRLPVSYPFQASFKRLGSASVLEGQLVWALAGPSKVPTRRIAFVFYGRVMGIVIKYPTMPLVAYQNVYLQRNVEAPHSPHFNDTQVKVVFDLRKDGG